jgi:mRNA interferase HigB
MQIHAGAKGSGNFATLTLAMFPKWEHIAYVRIVAWNVLSSYADRHPETRVPLQRWRALVKSAKWNSMDDLYLAAPDAKVLNRERARFEIAGGNFRMVVAFDFIRAIAFIKFIGTHAEYDRIDALTVSLF